MTTPLVAVTGSNRGLGYALALTLAERGAGVVLMCRDRDRGETALRAVAAASTGQEPQLIVMSLDDLASVRGGAAQLLDTHDKLDALVNNASVFTGTRQISADGYELMFATNHLGPFLLTNLLLPALRRASTARVLTIAAPSTVALDFDDLQGESSFKPLHAFGASKMANLLFTFELARRCGANGIAANAIHPGLVRTDLMLDAPAPLRWVTRLASRSPGTAAAAIAPLVLGAGPATSGQLLRAGKPVTTNRWSRDPANQSRLWEISAELTDLDIRTG
jgi:NAD(P)-dependent dehydrogenase (short-subunit alcohol dehydrogenase family)